MSKTFPGSLRPYGSETRRAQREIMYRVYLLKSLTEGGYYIGQTDNIERRIHEHNSGQEKATRGRAPLTLIGYEEYETRNEARWREYQLKKSLQKRKIFFKKLNFIPG